MAEEITFDPQDLTFAELEEIEHLAGAPIEEVLNGVRTARALKVLTFVVLRRQDPTVTFESMDSFTMRQVPRMASAEDPTDAAG